MDGSIGPQDLDDDRVSKRSLSRKSKQVPEMFSITEFLEGICTKND
jgi:hypothetical protein